MIAYRKVRMGLVGAGAIAQAYAQAFRETGTAEIVGVADVRREAADGIAQSFNCESFESHVEMVAAVEPEAVVVCTPPATHPDICVELMQCGVHVLCEKPLAVDTASAQRIIDAAEAAGVTFTMASKFRYAEDVIRAKSIVSSGILGEIVLFENAFTAHVDMSRRWNSNPEISGGGVLIDNGTHSIDIMRYFFGPLAEVQVIEGKRPQELAVEDTVRMFVRTEGGIMGSVDLSWSINKGLADYISIYGSYGTIRIGWKESKYRRSSDDEWIVFGNGYNKVQAFRNQIDNFARAIRGQEGLLITPEDALASVQVVEAAYAALRNSSWQPVGADIVEPEEAFASSGIE